MGNCPDGVADWPARVDFSAVIVSHSQVVPDLTKILELLFQGGRIFAAG
jgi:hypothetical protein